ncbi:hypothetical protein [Streptomyces olivaceiscleroticus]|uniref:DUF3558 domain-containing protein n=1 Tax=Streptomyces olivaceiscleroticus TaxID=68245 RepID=A0ABN0ZUS5_9ACTN
MVRNLLICTFIVAAVAGVTSCSPDSGGNEANGNTAKTDSLCGTASDGKAKKALFTLAGTQDLRSIDFGGVSEVASQLRETLDTPLEHKDTRPLSTCGIYPARQDAEGITIEFSWEDRFAFSDSDDPDSDKVFYNLGESVGEVLSGKSSYIYTPCEIPGKYAKEADRRLIVAHAFNHMADGGPVTTNSQDDQLTVLNAVARQLTRKLGCANAPLKNAPDLQHYPTMSDAADAAGTPS